jgi:selenocysteine lyase/cysteine desulfurase
VQLAAVPGVTIYGPPPARGRAALASFNVDNLHATDISTALNDFHGELYCPMRPLSASAHHLKQMEVLRLLGDTL